MTYTSNKTGAATDGATDDAIALVGAGGLGKDIKLQAVNKLQSLNGAAATIDLIYIDGNDDIHIGENTPIVLESSGVLVSATGVATATPDVSADDVTIDGTGNRGQTIVSGNASNGNLVFADPDDSLAMPGSIS